MANSRSRRTDFGTIAWHWLLVICLSIALATGLRIAADEPSLRWLVSLDAVLPKENLWLWHVVGALGFSACLIGYATYVVLAKLTKRSRLDLSRLRSVVRGGNVRWTSLGVVALWIAFAAFVIEILSGILLYLGQADAALTLHRNTLCVCLAFPLVHVALHLVAGGAQQVLRIFRPTWLAATPPEPDILGLLAEQIQLVDDLRNGRPEKAATAGLAASPPTGKGLRPFVFSLIASAAVGLAGVVIDRTTTISLRVPSIGTVSGLERPVIDGDTSDPVWVGAQPVTIMTEEGANFDGTGQSRVELRAVHDFENIYMAVSWEDPTRSIKHLPLIKSADGWHVVRSQPNSAVEDTFNEDKLAILISRPTIPIVGAAIHVSPSSLPAYPAGASGRGLHFTAPGAVSDVWVWRAAHGGTAGYLEDDSFAAPRKPTEAQASGHERYTGGFSADPGKSCFEENISADESPTLTPMRLPLDLTQTVAMMGEVHVSGQFSEKEGANWWLTSEDSVPYSVAGDALVPIGTMIPGIVVRCSPAGDVADVLGVARWSANRWTLELVRALDTGSSSDVAIVSGTMMWLGAFDHAATYHTRHIRPVTLELE